ncbi:MAG TPA: hypothetical protein PLS15_12335 [Fimbriimonadaceae bacterium]|nr:hypothetical protein [Fimbriimonadaceae bacterium]HRE94578.1 hypothetical protein [Fimbriimonadaceae bacterium]
MSEVSGIIEVSYAIALCFKNDSADRLTGQQVTRARATFVMDAVGNITVKSQEGTSPQTIALSSVARPLTRSGNIHTARPCP